MLDYIDAGGLVVSANARAARALELRYAGAQQQRGRQVWATPKIYDWQGWLRTLWQSHSVPGKPLFLSGLQEFALWRRVMDAEGPAQLVVSGDALAALAQQAYALLDQYEAHAERNRAWADSSERTDAEQFRTWAARFEAECRRQQSLPVSRLESYLADEIREGRLAIEGEVRLLGFDHMTPAQKSLVDALSERGCEVRENALPEEPAHAEPARLVEAADARDEILTCAWWARKKLEANASARIAIIVPGVDEMRGEIERSFRHVLAPQSASITSAGSSQPFEFSLGQPLASVPMVQAALLLLGWLAAPLESEQLSWLAVSGFFAGDEAELIDAGRLDAAIHDCGLLPPQISLDAYAARKSVRSRYGWAWTDRLGKVLKEFRIKHEGGKARSFEAWAQAARSLLERARWPGHGTLSSFEFQARKRWMHLLDEIAALDFLGGSVRYSEFLRALEHSARETIFAPESMEQPVQVMGPLESAGQSFDALWFLGADDEHWPQTAHPHPLLPVWLQRKFEMPHGSTEIDWKQAARATRRIASAASACVFSHARSNQNGALRPSPVLEEISVDAAPPLHAASLREEMGVVARRNAPSLEDVEDSAPIPWPADMVAGGSEVLKRQAACPFQSFAVKRLDAREVESGAMGLSAAERGKILHRVLESFWSADEGTEGRRTLRSRDDLLATQAAGTLEALIGEHVDAVLAPYRERAAGDAMGDGWMMAYLDAERRRLTRLLAAWLGKESERQPFQVLYTERRLDNVTVGDLNLNLRADRIDELPDGTRLLIDYKSSEVSAAQWEGERPEEPQLPLYAAFGGIERISGVLFAQIRANKMKFDGRVEDAHARLCSGLESNSKLLKNPYSEAMLEEWQASLQRLADAFLHGDAQVDPKQFPKTCQYCALPGLCRVRETSVVTRVADDAGSAGQGDE